MSIQTLFDGNIPRAKAAPPLPSYGGGYGAEWQWNELARELRRMFEADKTIDYSKIDPMMNSIVGMALNTIVSASTESRLRLAIETEKGISEDLEHPLSALFIQPNPELTIEEMLATTRMDLNRGNAYWFKERSGDGTGDVVALWLLPRQFMRARWPMNGSEFISHYELYTERGWVRLEKRDVIHFRRGLDTSPGFDGRYGLDPLKTAQREVAIDERAGDWAAVVLENHGMVSAILTPKAEANLSHDQVMDRVKRFQTEYTGANRGKLLLATLALDVQKLGLDPKTMDFGQLHDRAESRIFGLLNVPAALGGAKVGVEAGMAKANSTEDTRRLWTLSILPTERIIEGRLEVDLLPEFDETTDKHYVDHDHSDVEALRANLKEAAEIAVSLFNGGITSRNTSAKIAQVDVDEKTPDYYVIPEGAGIYLVGESAVEALAATRPPVALPPGQDAVGNSGAGDGDESDHEQLTKTVRALPPAARRALKAAVDDVVSEDREGVDGAAVEYWGAHATPAMRRLLTTKAGAAA